MIKILAWGTGHDAEEIFSECITLDQYSFVGVIDNDISKQGKLFHGIDIMPSDAVLRLKGQYDKIVILTKAYDEISLQIEEIDSSLINLVEDENYFYKQSIIKRYENNTDPEVNEVIQYIQNHRMQVFNYEFIDEYAHLNPPVYKDIEFGLFYVIHKGIKMYFSRSLDSEEKVLEYYRSILLEQDICSPHRYIDDDFYVDDGSIVVDVGAAEGNFAIEVLGKAKKIYIIEADSLWAEALRCTFIDYKNKVHIIEKYISSYNEGKIATLDSLIDENVDFIKMDIEGAEYDALIGARRLLDRSRGLKMAVCCYHSDYDEILIDSELSQQGFNCKVTNGFMWYPFKIKQSYISTKLNRAVIRAYKD